MIFSNWNEMYLEKRLLKNIEHSGFEYPRNVQKSAIPYISEGYDVKCQSETGTGKTAAFLIPIINDLLKTNATVGLPTDRPTCLIIAPTRELIAQIYFDTQKLIQG